MVEKPMKDIDESKEMMTDMMVMKLRMLKVRVGEE